MLQADLPVSSDRPTDRPTPTPQLNYDLASNDYRKALIINSPQITVIYLQRVYVLSYLLALLFLEPVDHFPCEPVDDSDLLSRP